MTRPEGILEDQAQAMIDELRQHATARCKEVQDTARQEAQGLVRDAWRTARGRLHQAVQAERDRRTNALARASARLDTTARERAQARVSVLLTESRTVMVEELQRLWRDERTRRAWCDNLIAQGIDSLGRGGWVVEHPPDLAPEEIVVPAGDTEGRSGNEPVLRACDDIAAGLRIRTPGACLDGTIDGLLADRGTIEGRVLAEVGRSGATAPAGSPEGARG
jgi:hypothetical protein